jgi:ferredoxin
VSDKGNSKTKKTWRVEFDRDACSLCEMCVNRCPTQALFVRQQGENLEILFDLRLCDGCRGEMYCEFHCPEKAVKITRISSQELPADPVILIDGEMSTCQECGSRFMPERKLATLLDQEKITPKSVQKYCPACRRQNLIENYLDINGQG